MSDVLPRSLRCALSPGRREAKRCPSGACWKGWVYLPSYVVCKNGLTKDLVSPMYKAEISARNIGEFDTNQIVSLEE